MSNRIEFVDKVNTPTSVKKTAKGLLTLARKNKSGYEVIMGLCIPYYDFDYGYNNVNDQLSNEAIDREKSLSAVRHVFPAGDISLFSSNGYSSTKNKYKNSYHILVRGVGYANCGRALPQVEHCDPNVYAGVEKRQLFRLPYLSKEGEDRPLVCDIELKDITPEIYQRWFVSNVEGEQLKWTYTEEVAHNLQYDCEYADKIAEVFPDIVKYKEYYRTLEDNCTLFINYKDIVKSECPICKRTHDDNQFYGFLSEDKRLFYKCKKSNKSVFVHNYGDGIIDTPTFDITGLPNFKKAVHGLAHKRLEENLTTVIQAIGSVSRIIDKNLLSLAVKFSKKTIKPKKIKEIYNDTNHKITHKTIYGFLKVDNIDLFNELKTVKYVKPTISELIEQGKQSAQPDIIPKDAHMFDSKYCSDYDTLLKSEHNIIGVRSEKGTGKSIMASKSIKNCTPDDKVLIVSFRISLAETSRAVYKSDTMKCYRDTTTPITDNHVILQLDSFHRLRWKGAIKKVVFDEFTQIRRHLTCSTYINNRNAKRNFAMFKYVVKNAEHLLLMDADLTREDISFIKRIRNSPDDTSALFVNTYKNLDERKMEITSNIINIIDKIKHDVSNKDRCVLVSNGATNKLQVIQRMIGGNSLLITRDTLDNPNVIEALANPNTEFGKYTCVIMSPTVQSGLSYDVKDSIHNVYGLFNNFTGTSTDACQMLHRVRHPTGKYIICLKTNNHKMKYISKYALVKHIQKNRIEYQNIENITEYEISTQGENEFVHNDWFNLYLENKVATDTDLMHFDKNFINLNINAGLDLSTYESNTNKDILEQLKGTYKLVKSCIENERITEIAEHVMICDGEIKKIQEKLENCQSITKHESLSLKKHKLFNVYGINKELEFDKLWYIIYEQESTIKHYFNQSYLHTHNNFTDSIASLKKREVSKQLSMRRDAEDDDTVVAMKLVNMTFRYNAYAIIVKVLMMLGINSFYEDVVINGNEIKDMLVNIHRELCTINDLGALFNKPTKLIQKMYNLKSKDTRFSKAMLEFINGYLKCEFNVSIKKVGKHDNNYTLFNHYEDNFVCIHKTYTTEPPCSRPRLAHWEIKEVDNDDEERVNPEEQLLELSRKFDSI